jgi:RND superfamily putative drug exporter
MCLTLEHMIEKLAALCHRRRWTVLFAWIAVVVGVSIVAGAAGNRDVDGGRLNGTDSDKAGQIVDREFPAADGSEATIVFSAADGVAAHRAAIDQFVDSTRAIPGVTGAVTPFDQQGRVSADGRTAYVPVKLDRDTDGGVDPTGALRQHAAAMQRQGVETEFLGDAFTAGSVPAGEGFGLLAAAFILLIAFGSVVAMGLPIVTAVAGIVTSLGGVTLWSHVVQTPGFTAQVASMIGIGVGIDYALFIVTRYRAARARGLAEEQAIGEAFGTAGRAVTFAGCTVVISLLGMLLMGMSFFHGLALGTSSAVLVAVLAALTLLPALLGFAGDRIDRFSVHRRRHNGVRETAWHRWSRLVQRNPKRFAVAGFVVLLVAAAPVVSMRLATADAGNDPAGSTTRKAYDLLAGGFGPGANGPLYIVADTPDAAARVHVADLAARLAATPGVATVGAVVASPSGRAEAITVIPTTSPQDVRTEDLVRHLRDTVIPASGSGAHIGGQTASNVDFADLMSSRLPIFIGAVLLLSFLLLLAVFRSVLVPLKAVVMNLLSIGAAYGVMVMIFQWGWLAGLFGLHGAAPIEPWAPMMLFAIVFGLSMDYEVFLLSAVKEDYDATGDNSHAVVEGLASTARVITAAAAIMVFVFGSFILGDMRAIKLMGLGLSVAVLVDATIVRMILVPATMELLGDRNWWLPRWLDRRLPHLQVERTPHLAVVPTSGAVDDERDLVEAGSR